ncbi:tetratricopeptide repeat protein [Sphaerisporangium sp. TRM90804]|uniref:tetratricopeptide repeat protein n=1 Tax=Sphaerisporangium sp. TRM90804 TaxID=3031113 RepID=UPI00244C2555|nr:tetratricopeptide repeat protein [Sphaerisporangium sp. TRM90804]MDH2428738.1 tetratricopeptide repeat protein [Sphaerisporangium sp. TRM90804]
MSTEDRIERSRLLYEQFVFGGDATALVSAGRELDAVEADLTLARGRVMHGRFLAEGYEDPRELPSFEHAAQLYETLGDVRGVAESLFWVGIFHQVVRRDDDAAVPVFERSREFAAQVADPRILSYVLRHLGIAAHARGRLDDARAWLEESVRLRRQLGLLPGVAANMVGLAYIAAAQGRRDDAVALLDEAGTIAESTGAHGITRQVEEARTSL